MLRLWVITQKSLRPACTAAVFFIIIIQMSGLQASDALPEMNREDCIEECWLTYGDDRSETGRRMHIRCLIDCDRKYWKDYDDQMEDLEESSTE